MVSHDERVRLASSIFHSFLYTSTCFSCMIQNANVINEAIFCSKRIKLEVRIKTILRSKNETHNPVKYIRESDCVTWFKVSETKI